MHTIVSINVANYGSTGTIMMNISTIAEKMGFNVFTACSNHSLCRKKKYKNQILIGSYLERNIEIQVDKWFGIDSCFCYFGTLKLIREIKKIKPDIIHLHNLHGGYINIWLLFRFIKREKLPVVWTFHDCWPFTGHCPYFDLVNCRKWVKGCYTCENMNVYPVIKTDRTSFMWKLKRNLFTEVENLTIVTPSKWLANLVTESYFFKSPVKVINNGIDLSIFKPVQSDFRVVHQCENKFILLAVAFGWNIRKGLDILQNLANRLDSRFQLVIVGTDDIIEKQLPNNVIKIRRTANPKELAKIYSSADLFINPTREENYPTVNMEAIACGTPVITFNTGGSPEIPDENTGAVVKTNSLEEMYKLIIEIYNNNPFTRELCIERAKQFDCYTKYKEYVDLYLSILER